MQVGCSVESAFDLMADARNEVRWNSAVSRSDLLTGEPVGAGSRFLTVNRGRDYNATIASFERPNRLVFEVTSKQMDITASFTFSAEGTGTIVQEHLDFRPKSLMKVIFPVMAPLVRRDLPKQGARFKTLCEASVGPEA